MLAVTTLSRRILANVESDSRLPSATGRSAGVVDLVAGDFDNLRICGSCRSPWHRPARMSVTYV